MRFDFKEKKIESSKKSLASISNCWDNQAWKVRHFYPSMVVKTAIYPPSTQRSIWELELEEC